jgi:hypothetical protein
MRVEWGEKRMGGVYMCRFTLMLPLVDTHLVERSEKSISSGNIAQGINTYLLRCKLQTSLLFGRHGVRNGEKGVGVGLMVKPPPAAPICLFVLFVPPFVPLERPFSKITLVCQVSDLRLSLVSRLERLLAS